MVDFIGGAPHGYEDVLRLVRFLRSEEGCEWDRAQTHESIRRNFIEEVYEACDAMNDPEHLCEELGDVLLQVIFHAEIERDAGSFSMDDVCRGICEKLIARHPHLFAGGERRDWETLKRELRGNQTVSEAMEDVSKALPAAWRADKVQSKAEKAGFAFENISGALDKLCEEVEEFRRAAESGEGDPLEELGDVLFAAVCAGRFLKADPEDALNAATRKFTSRFSRLEQLADKPPEAMTREELLDLWQKAKAGAGE